MFNILLVGLLVTLSGLFSGLTLGLMSLAPNELARKATLGDSRAKKVYDVRKSGNRLLVTLLVGNVASISVLSIVLDAATSGLVAALATTGLITVFGEIIPQAVFSRYALALGSSTAWLVKLFLVLFFPVAAPLAWVLDKLLGEELPTRYSRKELVGILREHGGETIESHEERIARGALTFSGKRVREVMTPKSMVHAVEQHQRLNQDTVKRLHDTGFSRFPVYDTTLDHVVGVLYAQQLLGRASHNKEAVDVCDRSVRFVPEDAHLDQTLNSFIKSKRHLFIVLSTDGKFAGIISIEDVIEEILGVEIVDEFDKYEDLRSAVEEVRRSHVHSAESEN